MNSSYNESGRPANKPSNYVTLGDYNEVYPLGVFKPCPNERNHNHKENYGAFSLQAAVRYPYSCCRGQPNCHQNVVSGVN
jgi:hypothetical protein